MNFILRYLLLFVVGAGGYGGIEMLYRSKTHWSMQLTGGLCFVLICHISMKRKDAPLWKNCLMGALIITIIELFVGLIVNVKLGWRVWDYSRQSFNLFGQICPSFSILWFFLCFPVCFTTRFLRQCKNRLTSFRHMD